MKLKVQLIIESDSGETEAVQAVANLERHSLRPENLGLTLSEAKELLQEVQRAMVTHQTTAHMADALARASRLQLERLIESTRPARYPAGLNLLRTEY